MIEDKGKASDKVTLHQSIIQRDGRAHMYDYREVMRYSHEENAVPEHPGWMLHTIQFFCRQSNVDVQLAIDKDIGMVVTDALVKARPTIMTADENAMAECSVAMAHVLGNVLANVALLHGEAVFEDTISRIASLIRQSGKDTARTSIEMAVKIQEAAREQAPAVRT